MVKFIFLTDTHGQARDVPTIMAAREFAQWFKPDYLIGGGDFWDLKCLRSGASEEDQNFPLTDDLKCAEDTFDLFFGSYHKAKKAYLYGNHDLKRVEPLLNSPRAAVRELATRLHDDMRSVVKRMCDDSRPYCKRNGIYEVEGFNFLHGYACGVNSARRHAISYRHSLHGHVHSFGAHTLEDLNCSTAYSCGCACELDQGYNAAQIGTLRQEHGFAYGFLDATHGYDIHFARKMNGSFFLPSEWNNSKKGKK